MMLITAIDLIKCRPLAFVCDLIADVVWCHKCATGHAGTEIEPIDVHQIDEHVGVGNDGTAWVHCHVSGLLPGSSASPTFWRQ